jgi:hypothetical protein
LDVEAGCAGRLQRRTIRQPPVSPFLVVRWLPFGKLGEGVGLGRVLGEWFGWEADAKALDEIGHAVGVHLERESLA